MTPRVKILGTTLLALCLAFSLTGCGKKAQPTPPDGSSFPRQYPKSQ